ncbi:helix-turn-helix domain-containing protein [Chthonobacter albigriseus]|uniref:helix-turn-helix domain-containing protein n=1 Tax=Chthonobacter albigriseus TaxID=1683161 RepID=UPI0031403119
MTPTLCRAARVLLEWHQPDLAENAGVGLSTVVDFEKDRRAVSQEKIDAMRAALEAAGIEFLNHGRPGVRLIKPTGDGT